MLNPQFALYKASGGTNGGNDRVLELVDAGRLNQQNYLLKECEGLYCSNRDFGECIVLRQKKIRREGYKGKEGDYYMSINEVINGFFILIFSAYFIIYGMTRRKENITDYIDDKEYTKKKINDVLSGIGFIIMAVIYVIVINIK